MADQDLSRVDGPPQPLTVDGMRAVSLEHANEGPPPIQLEEGELIVLEDVRDAFAGVFVDAPDTSNALPAFPDAITKEAIPAIKAEPVNGAPPVRDELDSSEEEEDVA